jgi:hypothetical protein
VGVTDFSTPGRDTTCTHVLGKGDEDERTYSMHRLTKTGVNHKHDGCECQSNEQIPTGLIMLAYEREDSLLLI